MSASVKLFQAASGGGGDSYWASNLTISGVSRISGINVDNDDNIIITSKLEDGTYDDVYIAKLSTDGEVIWSNFIEYGTSYGQSISSPGSPAVDSDNNIYVTHNVAQPSSSYINDWAITKVDSDGDYSDCAVLYGTSGSGYDRGDAIIWDGTNLLSTGDYNNTNDVGLVKLNTSLGVTASKLHANSIMNPTSVSFDGSNYYVTAEKNGFYGFPAYALKFDTSLNFVWARELGRDVSGSASSPRFYKALGINGDVYCCGHSSTAPSTPGLSTSMYIVKLNSSGVVQWQRTIGDEAGSEIGSIRSAGVTSDDKLVVAGNFRPTSGSNSIYVAMIDTSTDTIDWDLVVDVGSAVYAFDMTIDSQDNIIMAGAGGTWVVKLPQDGSITGTFDGVTISEKGFSLDIAANSEDTRSVSMTNTSPTISDRNTSFSTSTKSFSESITSFS